MKKENGSSSRRKKSSSLKTKRKRSSLETLAEMKLREANINNFVEEHRFCERRWRFDFAWPNQMVALEVEGGVWKGGKGGHTSGVGFTKDCEKYNTATVMGWKVLRVVGPQIRDGSMINWVKGVLSGEIEDDPFPVANVL